MSRKFKRRQTTNGRRSTANGRHNAAFTLIEVLVAFLIMSVGLLGILVLFPVGIMASARSSNLSRSAVVARSAISSLASQVTANDNTIIYNIYLYDIIDSPPKEDGPWLYPQDDEVYNPDGDGDAINNGPETVTCDEATAFSWNATVSQAVDASGSEIQGLYAVQIRVFRNFAVMDGPGTVTFTEDDKTVTGAVTNWVIGRELLVGQYIKCEPAGAADTDADGFWYEISAINSDTELVLRRPYYGDGDTNLGENFSGKDYVITKSLIAVYDTYLAARAGRP